LEVLYCGYLFVACSEICVDSVGESIVRLGWEGSSGWEKGKEEDGERMLILVGRNLENRQ
jgi:hypothetical protein